MGEYPPPLKKGVYKMKYDVIYKQKDNDGYERLTFENMKEALRFAKKYNEATIITYEYKIINEKGTNYIV